MITSPHRHITLQYVSFRYMCNSNLHLHQIISELLPDCYVVTQRQGALQSLKLWEMCITFLPTLDCVGCGLRSAAGRDKNGLRDQITDYWVIDELDKQSGKESDGYRKREQERKNDLGRKEENRPTSRLCMCRIVSVWTDGLEFRTGVRSCFRRAVCL